MSGFSPPGASGGGSCAKTAPTWPHLGPQNGPKIDEKSTPKSIENLDPFRRRFFTDLGRFLKPKWSPEGSKIEAQTDILFEGRFAHGCTFSLRENLHPRRNAGHRSRRKSLQKTIESRTETRSHLEVDLHRFLVDFSCQDGPQNRPKIDEG